MKDGIHAREACVIRQPPPLSRISHRKALTRRAPCACGRGLPSLAEPSARRVVACASSASTFRAVGIHFSAAQWEFEAIASTALLVSFLPVEKSTYFSSFAKGECMLFFAERKASKELQAYGLTICAAGSGSVAAMKDGIHAREARVIRQPPLLSQASCRRALTRRAPCACGRASQWHVLPARRMVACASPASTAAPFEPWACTSQQMVESPRRESR